MRWITLLLLGCLLAGWAACQWEGSHGGEAAASSQRWIRTVDGWERAADLRPADSPYTPPLHPLVIASGQLMLALLAFLLFPPQGAEPPQLTFIERRRPNSDRRRGERRQGDRAACA